MTALSFDELKQLLQQTETKENDTLVFLCTLDKVPFTLRAQLKYSDTGDCGKGYEYLYEISIWNDETKIFSSDPLYNADETLLMFSTFMHKLGFGIFFGKAHKGGLYE